MFLSSFRLSKPMSQQLTKVCDNKDPYYSIPFISTLKFNCFNLITSIDEESHIVDIENLQGETNPLDVDPFSFIDVWSSDSMPSKASESSHKIPFTHFDEVVEKFWRLAFDQPLEDFFSNPDYNSQLQWSINEFFKFNDLVVDEIQKEIESFLNIFNNAFKDHQLHSQHIVEIESSTE